jgi:formylglycine-generating enzyme required for sulfatase activity
MAKPFDPYHLWLGIPPEEQPANHYRLLGIKLFESNPDVVENAVDQRMVHLRSFQLGQYADLSQKLLNEVATAKVCLLRPEKKAAYDHQLREQLQSQAEAAESSRPEIDSQLALALERPSRKGRSHLQPRPTLGRGAILSTAVAVAALLVIIAVWAAATRKAPLTTAQPATGTVALKTATEAPKTGTEAQSHKGTAETPRSPIPNPKSQIANLKSQIPSPPSPIRNSSPLPPAVEGPRVTAVLPPPAKPAMSAIEVAKVQRQWAAHLALTVKQTNSIGMPLVLIPPGEFDMGSTPDDVAWALEQGKKRNLSRSYLERVPSEAPQHQVRITKPFYLGMYPVTQAEYQKVMDVNPSAFTAKQIRASAFQRPLPEGEIKHRRSYATKVAGIDTRRNPVEDVSYDDAMEFCRKLSEMPAEQAARRVYRLPTEAEWEYACRAGTTTCWYCGDDEVGVVDAAWSMKNADGMTHPVGKKRPNAWGLFDMCGNVSQWCADWFAAEYYKQSPPSDPAGPPDGAGRVHRGGSWNFPSPYCRSAYRPSDGPASRTHDIGFRVVADVAVDAAGLPATVASLKADSAESPRSPIHNSSPLPPAGDDHSVVPAGVRAVLPPAAVAPFEAAAAKQHQQAWAKHLGLPADETNSLGMPLLLIPPGEFDMGSTPDDVNWAMAEGKRNNAKNWYFERVPDELPRHRVKITRPFYLGMYTVTQAEYQKVMGVNPSGCTAQPMDASAFQPPLPEVEIKCRQAYAKLVAGKDTSRYPVETVNWNEAMEFCHRLSALPAEQAARRVYRLPTEAEWEYACRAGTATRWYCGDDEASLLDAAWFARNNDGMTHPVGEKQPNAWGLCDMHGNVWQWCVDLFKTDYYKESPSNDPIGPAKGVVHTLRGGAAFERASMCRSAFRHCEIPNFHVRGFGFRVLADVAAGN